MGSAKSAGLRVNGDSLGVAVTAALLLLYGLFRPGSLAFFIPFLIAPSLILLWAGRRSSDLTERRGALAVTAAVIAGVIAVLLVGATT